MDKRQVAQGFAWNVLFTIIGRIILPVGIGIALNRILGPFNVGAFATLASFTTVLDVLRDFGIVQNFVTDKDADLRREGQYFTLSVTLAFVIATLLWLGTPVVVDLLRLQGMEAAVPIMAISTVLTGMGSIPGSKLQKLARFRDYGICETSAQFISAIVSLGMALRGYGVWALIWAVPIRAGAGTLLYVVLAKLKPAAVDLPFLRSIVSRCTATLSNSLLSSAYTIGDTAVFGSLFGKVNAGYYSIAFNVAMKPVELVSWPLGRPLLLAFAHHRDDPERIRNVYARSIAGVLKATLPIFMIVAVFATEIVTFLYGHKFAGAGPILQILALYLFTRSLGTLSGGVLVAMGRPGLSNYGWIGAYAIVLTGFLTGSAKTSPISLTWWLTAGACMAYGFTVGIVWSRLKPQGRDLSSLFKALGANVWVVAVLLGVHFLPVKGTQQLGIALLIICSTYPLLLAKLFTGHARNALSIKGLKSIWKAM
ncbi:MAG TPA: oligosaccharide flippase family protein [Fimbriimonadaceae bacterium]|nr:oligosaccharide flippase family protein [Fimbriimonadaceae bacterium]